MKTYRIGLLLAGIVLLVSGAGAAEDAKDALKKRFRARFEKLQKYKNEGKVGETHLGYVEALKAEYLKTKELKELVEAENADRRKLYKIIAAKQSTGEEKVTPEQVGKQNAVLKFKKAAGSEYFKARDGKWRTKKEMLEAAEKEEA